MRSLILTRHGPEAVIVGKPVNIDHYRYPIDTSLIHIESRKPPTAELFDVDSGRISIVTANIKEYHSDVLAIITRIMHSTLNNSL
ncbi:hypothetical protein Tco_0450189 [Tanacetum coccineum]